VSLDGCVREIGVEPGWQDIAKELGDTPILLEQEVIDAVPPVT